MSPTPHRTTATGPPAARLAMDPMRKIALAGGLLYLLTFAASFPQLKLFARLVDDPEGFIRGAAATPPSSGALGSR